MSAIEATVIEAEAEAAATAPQPPKMRTQKLLLLSSLRRFFSENPQHLRKMIEIVNREKQISLRIVDWFVTNYAKQQFVVYDLPAVSSAGSGRRFKVHNEYKLTLKAYQKKNFDPFCRWERIRIPYDETTELETTIGQLNFFKWSIENRIIEYIEEHYAEIEEDMIKRNSLSKRKNSPTEAGIVVGSKTRKKREELSTSASKFKKEEVKVVIRFCPVAPASAPVPAPEDIKKDDV